MEKTSEEFLKKQQDILSLYKNFHQDEQEQNLFIEKYTQTCTSCQDLGSSNPLKREKSRESFPVDLEDFMKFLATKENDVLNQSKQDLFSLIETMQQSPKWEVRAGGLTASTIFLEKYTFNDFEDQVFGNCIKFLFQQDIGISQPLLSFLKAFTKKHGLCGFGNIQEKLFDSLDKLWSNYQSLLEEEEILNSNEQAKMNPLLLKDFFKARSDTNIGIELFYKALLAFAEGTDGDFILNADQLKRIYRTKSHAKQEIRSLGCELIGTIIPKISNDLWKDELVSIGEFLIELMGDEFTTVRHQATFNTLKFVERVTDSNQLLEFAPSIVPKILVNRYYPAEALSKDSINLWKLYLEKIGMPTGGKDLLGKFAKEACQFYLKQLKKSHHEIVKSACFALRELMTKVEESSQPIQEHFDELLDVFLRLARDGNPSVRSTVFGVLDSLALKCPEKSRSRLSEFLDIGFFQICFNFKSEPTAEVVALYLAEINKAFQNDVDEIFRKSIGEKILAFEKGEELVQVSEEKVPIVYKGEVIRPKGFEVSTGALILLSELISINPEIFNPFKEVLLEILSLRKTGYYDTLIFYAWKVFYRGFGVWDKKTVKSQFEIILEPLIRDLKSSKPNIAHSASQIIKIVASKIGENITKAKVEAVFDKKYEKDIDIILASN